MFLSVAECFLVSRSILGVTEWGGVCGAECLLVSGMVS